MQDIRIEGTGHISGGEYGTVKVDGLGQCNGDLKAELLDVDGKFKCLGALQATTLECDGFAECTGSISAKAMKVDGMLNLQGEGSIEADTVRCDGCIKLHGQLSADEVRVSGSISAREIVGDRIVIHTFLGRLSRLFSVAQSQVELIEATHIDLVGVTANTVNGSEIIIGPGCVIENLDCNGKLTISPGAQVKNITGDYTRM